MWVHVCVSDFSKTTTARDFCQLIVPMNFHALENFVGFADLKRKDKRVIAILATLSKRLITPKLLQLKVFFQICCSATLLLAIRWYIVQGSIAFHK